MAREISRWDPFREVTSLRDEIDRLFDSFFGRQTSMGPREGFWVPPIDVEETDNEYIIKAELPGVKKNDVKISATEDTLTISGERKIEREEKGKTYHKIEMNYGQFERSIKFPTEVIADKAKATYKDGILTVSIPKSEKAKPKELEIQVE
ncbi:MAG TPA: Hsp20/alpha crystallin family protein [Candidatus Hydrothermia bacterium]|nr:Hsp20/alpha crystallin family protein [Candidatus Hydrothermae bacterium]MDD3648683.1 Hsp20/alpha crystallin family protein [Candidatus Hydrothermia bacterium]MDD5572264.1 Hsp20/alpha crystallin family protein [Candidatus Hydrothermia bacterium]HOK22457.1 Hsp20/alpha crystallin family protein [Candidatus Hydrothermia bacterium]HOL23164.1 Hsp20/alpha crystallin family protein [Candidatus Hydrothermia bacterium]